MALDKDGPPPIVLIDARVLVRDSLVRCIGEWTGLTVVGAGSVDEWLSTLQEIETRQSEPSLILLSCCDCFHAAEEPIRQVDALVAEMPQVPVVVIADCDNFEFVLDAIAHGARGYIPTCTSASVAMEAINLVMAGGIYFPASSVMNGRGQQTPAMTAPARAPEPSKPCQFTARQAAVIDALRRGKANKIIAYELNMRESTVKVHVRNIMKRLNAKNRTEVAFLASQLLGPITD